MKANEFFKKHGWNDTKVMIESPFGLGEYEYLWDDLKRLVESHELVMRYKLPDDIDKDATGINGATLYLDHYAFYSNDEEKAKLDRLKQAIADVESCMEVNDAS